MDRASGDGWELRLGDCLDPETGLASLGGVDHVISDPPFEKEAHTKQRREKRGGGVMELEPLSFGEMDEDRRSAIGLLFGARTRRWAVIFCQIEASQAWASAMCNGGMTYRRTGIWRKPDGMPQYSGDRPGMGYETISICHAKGRSKWNAGGKHGVWRFNKMGPEDRNRTGHPTQKPLALMEALVLDFTDPGDLVCDPFAGSGTTAIACLRHGRRFIGWEKDPEFFDVAVRRIEGRPAKLEGQEELFG